ncbi:MAG: hypothetical protein JXB39_10255 [Deltaproteobacteria bacterium]|nr:hypothetical protein [Deltaproteobacteria bacterium]
MMRAPLLLFVVLGAGCAEGPYAAPYWASVVVGNDVVLEASEAFTDVDGEGTLAAAEVMVVDGRSDVPMPDIEVEVTSSAAGVYVLPEDAVQEVDGPGEGTWLDALSGRTYTFDLDGGDVLPGSLVAGTDGRGVLTFYLFVDALPREDASEKGLLDFAAAEIRASIQVDSDTFQVTAE